MTTTSPTVFRFTRRAFDSESGTLRLGYAYPGQHEFTEEIAFGPAAGDLSADQAQALENAFRALHLACGVSYYKAFVPGHIEIEEGPLDPAAADFFENLYLHGLGEFAHRNGLDLAGRICFPRTNADSVTATPPRLELPHRTLVPVGGGKDSLVTVEALRNAGPPVTLAAVNRAGPIVACIAESGLPSRFISRRIDPALLALNQQGAYNGHVPITAIVSLIMVCTAILYGFDAIAFSNERSADEGNVEVDGKFINHQFSKSLAFETALANYIRGHIAEGLTCFSFLRPLSELHIAKLFARENRYDGVFTSCNKSYRIHDAMTDRRWCGQCPKCRFVFLALAPFMDQARLLAIFDANLLDDASQLDGFRDLVGLGAHKPWECVGEIQESAAALWTLGQRPEWRDAAVVARLRADLAPGADTLNEAMAAALTPRNPGALPEPFQKVFSDATGQ